MNFSEDRITLLSIHKKVGQKSRTAGIVLAILSLFFLGLSLYFRTNVIFQIDSIVCLLAAIAVFLRGESSSIQIRLVNRMINSTNETLNELSSISPGEPAIFNYVPLGNKVTDVVVTRVTNNLRPTALEASTDGQSTMSPVQSTVTHWNLIPPGRALAELYLRELNIVVSTELLLHSLKTILCERFELASDLFAKQSEAGDSYEIILSRPAINQSCVETSSQGIIGCPISSMLAVLFCHASKRAVSLIECRFDSEKIESKILLRLFSEDQ